MLKVECVDTSGWEAAIRGMRNPKNSWEKSDTVYGTYWGDIDGHKCFDNTGFALGKNDLKLATTLADAGQVHGKFLRMIVVTMDITAPLYWWKEYDTYKVGTVANSCSTMHKIHCKPFTLDDFSHEHLNAKSLRILNELIQYLNEVREIYNSDGFTPVPGDGISIDKYDKSYWWQMIQMLPSSYNQKRTVMLSYAVLKNIYEYRHNHKLDEWKTLCCVIEKLPYAKELIIGVG